MHKNALLILVVLAFSGAQVKTFAAPLSGSYTINATLPATTTNFKNFASAIAYLTGLGTRSDGGVINTAPFGMNGPVEFLVNTGTYAERVILNGDSIPGLSITNRLTFTGDNANTTTITATISTQAVFLIKNCRYITIRNLGIINNAPYSTGIAIAGSALNNKGSGCRIVSCKVQLGSATTTYGIHVTADTLGWQQTPMKADSIVLDSNTIIANTAISITGADSGAWNRGFKMMVNSISYVLYGVMLNGIDNGFDIHKNTLLSVDVNATSGYALNANNCISLGPERIKISNNKLNVGGYGMYFSQSYAPGNPAFPVIIYNNMITGNLLGIYIATEKNFYELYHNSVYINNQFLAEFAAAAPLSYLNTGGTLKCKNNIFAVDAGNAINNGTAAGIQSTSTDPDTVLMNCNIYYNAGNPQRLVVRNAIYGSSNFKTAAGGGDSSFNITPGFVSLTDLHLPDNNCHVKGANLTGLFPFDFDENTRPSAPEIGCVEYQPISVNLRIIGISNSLPLPFGSQTLGIKVCNAGTTPVSTFTIAYKTELAAPVIKSWAGFLGTCDTTTVYFSGPQELNLSATDRSVKAYVYDPNGSTDQYPKNDTIIIHTPMQGTYIVGSAPSDYTTFGAAIGDMVLRGIRGPVIFSVKSGTYATAIDLNGIRITGVSSANSITFDGNNVATLSSASTVIPAITIKSINYVTIRNFTINSNNTGIHIVGGTAITNLKYGTGCAIKKCTITVPAGSSFYPIRATGATTGTRIYADSIEIDSNITNGGNTGIRIEGAFATGFNLRYKIRNNTINNISTFGIYAILFPGIDILNNTINKGPNNISNNLTPNGSGSSGIFVNGTHISAGADRVRIIGNKIACRTSYGLCMFENYVAFPSEAQQILNNSIVNSTTAGIKMWCIWEANPFYTHLYHNSVVTDSSVVQYGVHVWNLLSTYTCEAKNNIFAVTAANGFAIPAYFDGSPGASNTLNYNIYYNASGPTLLSRNGVLYSENTFKTGLAGGDASINMDPGIISTTDLQLKEGCRTRGTNLLFVVPRDILDSARSNPPSIGAYEFQGIMNDVGTDAIVRPLLPATLGLQDLQVRFVNNGLNILDSCFITYQMNGGAQVSKKWIGLLNPCDTATVIYTGSQQLNVGAVNLLKVYTEAPNGIADQKKQNDTITLNFGVAMHGIYTIGGITPDYTTFTAAANALNLRGVDGAVTFNVRNGTYTEQVILGAPVTGASAINTITFQSESGIRDSVKLTFAATVNANYLLKFNNTSYVKISAITFLPINATYSRGIEFAGTSSFDTIENCKIVALTSSMGPGIYANALAGGKNVIRNNSFTLCQHGISWTGTNATNPSDGNVFDGNSFLNVTQYNITLTYLSNTRIRDNVMVKTNTTGAILYSGISASSLSEWIEITGNKMTFSTGGSGIALVYSSGTLAMPGIVANNSISISGTGLTTQNGLSFSNNSNMRVYHNSISFEGTSGTTYAASLSNNTNNIDIRNNIFANMGTGPAAYLFNSGAMDNNLFYCTGTAQFTTTGTPSFYTSIGALRNATGNNLNSLFYRPAFTSTTDPSPNAADTAVWAINGRGIHLDSTFVWKDLNGIVRPKTPMTGAPDLGAYETTPTSIPPMATSNPAQFAPDSTQLFLFGGDSVAAIKWDVAVPLPASVTVRQYSGKQPSNINATDKYTYFHTDVIAPSASYYDLKLYYKDWWLGTVPQEFNLALAHKNASNIWNAGGYTSTLDTVRNTLFTPALTNFGLYTGTDILTPLPVRLLKFSGYQRANDIVLNWKTTNEINCNLYVIERSYNNMDYTEAGSVLATPGNAAAHSYLFMDETYNRNTPNLYYRLKMLDNDGSFEYSKTVAINLATQAEDIVSVYPNPFETRLTVSVNAQPDETATVELADVYGKILTNYSTETNKGTNMITLHLGIELPVGVYLLKVSMANHLSVLKVIKE